MGKKATITRERLLDLAEELVRNGGATALTIGALAQAAGLSKGGVQYAFRSKDALVRALVDRWTSQFDALICDDLSADPVSFVKSYIAATRAAQPSMTAKMAAILVSHMEDPDHLRETRAWYQGIFRRLAGDSPDARAARVAFLAVEGLFFMHIHSINEDEGWRDFLTDVEMVLDNYLAAFGDPKDRHR